MLCSKFNHLNQQPVFSGRKNAGLEGGPRRGSRRGSRRGPEGVKMGSKRGSRLRGPRFVPNLRDWRITARTRSCTRTRPEFMNKPDAPFYLGVNRTTKNSDKSWCKANAMGVNKLNKLNKQTNKQTILTV